MHLRKLRLQRTQAARVRLWRPDKPPALRGMLGDLSLFGANNLTERQPQRGCRSSVPFGERLEGRADRTISQLPEPQRHLECLYPFASERTSGLC